MIHHRETIVFGAGCFWCTEAAYQMLKGVESVEPGYTNHIEVAKIEYNPDEISFEELLMVFFAIHDPTSIDRQGNDVGLQYNSAIFYTTESQKRRAEHYVKVLNEKLGAKIVTQMRPLKTFYPAEDYHKKYYESHRDSPYCHLIIDPKVDKVREKFKNILK